MRISDWSSDVCSSDLLCRRRAKRSSAEAGVSHDEQHQQGQGDGGGQGLNGEDAGDQAGGAAHLAREDIGRSGGGQVVQDQRNSTIGRALCRELESQTGKLLVVAVSLKKHKYLV